MTVVNTRTLKVVATIPTGQRPAPDGVQRRQPFRVRPNGDEGTVSVVDVRSLRNDQRHSGRRPSPRRWPSRAGRSGLRHQPGRPATITGISATTHAVIARIDAEPGVEQDRFAPDGRLGFVVNRRRTRCAVIERRSIARAHGRRREGARPAGILDAASRTCGIATARSSV